MPELESDEAMTMFWSEVVGMCSYISPQDWPLFEAADLPEHVRHEILAWNLLLKYKRPRPAYMHYIIFIPENVVRRVALPVPILEALAVTANKKLLTAISKSPSSPSWLKGLSSSEHASAAIELHEKESRPSLRLILNSPSNALRLLLSQHPLAKSEINLVDVLDKLAMDDKFWVREFVAEHPNTSPSTLEKLAEDSAHPHTVATERESEHIKIAVANNPNTPPATLEKLANGRYSFIAVPEAVAENPNTPVATLVMLAGSKDKFILFSLAKNFSTPGYVMEKLAENNDELVLHALTENPSTPGHVLDKLAKSKSAKILKSLTNNPNTPTATLELIEKRIHVLDFIEKCNYDWVWEEIAKDPSRCHDSAAAEVLRKIVTDDVFFDAHVMTLIASNHKTPELALRRIAEEEDKLVRKAVATNPNAPILLLEKLIKDEEPSVRNAARDQLNMRQPNLNG